MRGLALALCLALLPQTSSAAVAGQLLICLDTANPPFMYATTGGRPAGVYPALLSEAFARMDNPAALEAVPWKRALAMSAQGQAGIGGIYKNKERLEVYDFSDVLYVERIMVLTAARSPFTFTGLESLAGKKVGVLRGWSYGDAFDKARREGLFQTEEVDGDSQNLSKLQAGRIDAMIIVKESAEMHLAASGEREAFAVHKIPLAENEAFLAFAKSHPKGDVIRSFNKALKSMREDGTLEVIVKSILAAP